MAATIDIYQWVGAGPTGTSITGHVARMSQNDVVLLDSSSTTGALPAVDNTYSCWVSTRLHCTAAPVTAVDTFTWFSDAASLGTSITVSGKVTSSYVQATTGPPTLLSGSLTNVVSLTSSAPASLTGSFSSGSAGTNAGQYFVYQAKVMSTSVAGPSAQATYSWQMQET